MGARLSLFRSNKPDIFFPQSPVQLPVHDTKEPKSLRTLVEERCPSLFKAFNPPWWLFNGHLQTLYCVVGDFTKSNKVLYHRKYIQLKDGGTLGLDFTPPDLDSVEESTPIIVVLHGLTGGSYEAYVRAILHPACKPASQGGLGLRGVVVNFRGCAGVPLTSQQLYSAGHTDDIRQALIYISHQYPKAPLIGVGFSLGANVLVRYLAEEKDESRLSSGCALACPWDLRKNCDAMESTLIGRHLYSKGMSSNLLRVLGRHITALSENAEHPTTKALTKVLALKSPTLEEFDDTFTRIAGGAAPTWPFASATDYYVYASSHYVLPSVSVPLLALNSADDPVVQKVPVELGVQNPWTIIGVTDGGGHLGWFEGNGRRWMTEPVLQWFKLMTTDVAVVQANRGREIRTSEDGYLFEAGREQWGCKEIEDAGLVQASHGDLFQGL